MVACGLAVATPITVNCSSTTAQTELGPGAGGTITCGTFNTALGTLTSIQITLNGSVVAPSSLNINNNDNAAHTGSAQTVSNFLLDGSTPLTGFGLTTGTTLFTVNASTGTQTLGADPNSPAACNNNAACSGTFAVTGAGNITATNSSNFAPYQTVGAGSFNITSDTQTGFQAFFGGGNVGVLQSTTDSFTATVIYNYTSSAAAPEPTTLLMMGSALVGLGLLRKRIKS